MDDDLRNLNGRGEPYTPKQQRVVDLVRARAHEFREHEYQGFSWGFVRRRNLFSRFSYSTQVLMPWVNTFFYIVVSLVIMAINWWEGAGIGQRGLALLFLVLWTGFHFWLQGWVFWRRLVGVIVILGLIAGYLSWQNGV
ncbi:MAG: hypothetical protein LBV12_01090 [Puniceicoccales bacterium]|jgi:hypothetical protein|nr:hypothetical protein [Puniceicoccales bacterium]